VPHSVDVPPCVRAIRRDVSRESRVGSRRLYWWRPLEGLKGPDTVAAGESECGVEIHQRVHAARVQTGGLGYDVATEGVADEIRLLDPQAIEDRDDIVRGRLVGVAVRRRVGRIPPTRSDRQPVGVEGISLAK